MNSTFLWLWLLGAPLLLAFFDLVQTRSGRSHRPPPAARDSRY